MISGQGVAAMAATAGGIFGGILYIKAVWAGKTKPHVFTWLIWGTLKALGGAVAFVEQAYWSFFVILAGCAINLIIVSMAWQRGDKNIQRSDAFIFLSALAIIPIWFFTKEPLVAAVFVSFVNLMGFSLTFKKAWVAPQEENIEVFSFFTMTSLLGLLSVIPFTLTTALYPTVILLSNAALVIMLGYRRRI